MVEVGCISDNSRHVDPQVRDVGEGSKVPRSEAAGFTISGIGCMVEDLGLKGRSHRRFSLSKGVLTMDSKCIKPRDVQGLRSTTWPCGSRL